MNTWLTKVWAKIKKFGKGRPSASRPPRRTRLEFEALEDRMVPTASVGFSPALFALPHTAVANVSAAMPSTNQMQIILSHGDTFAQQTTSNNGLGGFGTHTLKSNAPLLGVLDQMGGPSAVTPKTATHADTQPTGHGAPTNAVGGTSHGATVHAQDDVPPGATEFVHGTFNGVTTDFVLVGGDILERTDHGWQIVAQGVKRFALGNFAGKDTLFMVDNFGNLLSETSPNTMTRDPRVTNVTDVQFGSSGGTDYLVIGYTDSRGDPAIKYTDDKHFTGWQPLRATEFMAGGFTLETNPDTGKLEIFYSDTNGGSHMWDVGGGPFFEQER